MQLRRTCKSLQERNRCDICPLQVVEEKHERMLLAHECANKIMQGNIESVLFLRCPQRRNRRLRTQNQLGIGNHISNDSSVLSQYPGKGFAPTLKFNFALR